MDDFKNIIKEFEKRFYHLTKSSIIELNEKANSGELNNVVTARKDKCFGLLLKEDSPKVFSWHLFFVGGKLELEGALLELDLDYADNTLLVMMFSKFLSQKYPDLDLLDTFNTFQNHTITLLEKVGFWTISTEELEKHGDPNPVIVKKDTRGIVPIRTIDKKLFYIDFFGTELIENSSEPHVYLLLNPNLNHIKIGRSKKPGFREKTLQSQEPNIHLIACWPAPATIETYFHKKYQHKRIRGEWFKLNFNDLNEIKEYMTIFGKV